MPNIRVVPLILTTLCISFSAINAYADQDKTSPNITPLLPEVAEIVLTPKKPQLQDLKQNVYVGMLAINAPEDMDYMAIGAQVISNNFADLKKSLKIRKEISHQTYDYTHKHYQGKMPLELDDKIGESRYSYPCRNLNAKNCIEQTLQQKEQIQALITKGQNATIFKRYTEIQKLPQYNAYVYSAFDAIPPYHYYTFFTGEQLSQALFAFNEGDSDTGFKILAQEMAFAKRILREGDNIIGKMVGTNMLYSNYHTISVLLDTPQMQPYLQDPRLLALLEPLNKQEQKSFTSALEKERNSYLYFLYAFNPGSDFSDDCPEPKSLCENSRKIIKEILTIHFDRKATINTIYLMWQPVIERSEMDMNQVAKLYAQNKLENFAQTSKQIRLEQIALYNKARENDPNAPLNLTGNALNEYAAPESAEYYPQQIYDLQSYILLVNTKHQIVSKGLNAAEIDAYLKTAGKAPQNPITREPFTWDAQTGTLSTPWLAKHVPTGARENKEHMPRNTVYLKLK